jgi:hypothetical protein
MPQARSDDDQAARQDLHLMPCSLAAQSPVSHKKNTPKKEKGLFNLIRVIPFAGTAEPVAEQIVADKLAEGPRPLPFAVTANPRNRQLGVIGWTPSAFLSR